MTTRGHSLKLRKTECRGSIRANVFGVRVVNLWNSVPEELVSSATVNCFKGRFDRHCLRNRFSEEWIIDCSSDKRDTADTSLWEDQSTGNLPTTRLMMMMMIIVRQRKSKLSHVFLIIDFTQIADGRPNYYMRGIVGRWMMDCREGADGLVLEYSTCLVMSVNR